MPEQDLLPVIAEAVRALPTLPDDPPEDRYGPQSLTAVWLASFSSNHTRRAYFRDLGKYLAWCHGEKLDPLTDVLPADIVRFKATLTGGDSTVNRCMSAASSWYVWLIKNGANTNNPFAAAPRPPRNRDESNTVGLNVTEVKLLMAVVDREATASLLLSFRTKLLAFRDRLILRLLADMGMRREEICVVDMDAVSSKQGFRTLRYRGKGRKIHERPIPAHSLEALDEYLEIRGDAPGPLLVTLRADGAYGRVDGSQIGYTIKRIARAAKLANADRISPHSLRHAFATNSLDNGSSLRHIQDAMGHADPRTTRRYDRGRERLNNDPALLLGGLYSD